MVYVNGAHGARIAVVIPEVSKSDGSTSFAATRADRRFVRGASRARPPVPGFDEAEPSHDAFGSRAGVESLGLYSESQVRGFNLQEAGNYRLDGAYFVRAAAPSDVILRSLHIRVGPNALDLDFPAPSGVVAYA